MRWTIERLRLAIVAVAIVLLLSIAGFFLYARWRVRHIAQDLPARLGVQIQQSTQGFVLSKTEEGRTIFTLHAARAVTFKSGGRVLLHGVKIDFYNSDGQTDTIAGRDFQYDRERQIVISQGEAHILLHMPQGTAAGAPNKNTAQVIRVTAHGLVFNQKTGIATCSGEVDFQVASSSGQAVGAIYDSRKGHLLLQSQVELTTQMQNRPAVMHASQAVYDRDSSRVHLVQPTYSSTDAKTGEQGSARKANVLLRSDGSVERLDAAGAVKVSSVDGSSVQSSTMHALLNRNNRPVHIHFLGDVRFSQQQPDQQSTGTASDALLNFDAQGHTQRAIFNQNVNFRQQASIGGDRLDRTLQAAHLDLHLNPTEAGKAQLRSALATGYAVFRSRSKAVGISGDNNNQQPRETLVAGQSLKADFQAGNQIQHMEGSGDTKIRTVAMNGDIDTSTGDHVSVDFSTLTPHSQHFLHGRAQAAKRMKVAAVSAAPGKDTDRSLQTVRRAVQTGHVVLRQTSHKKDDPDAAPEIAIATAQRAEYKAAGDTLTLTGAPVFRNAQLEVAAHTMYVQRASGKTTAIGSVQGTLFSGGVYTSARTPPQAAQNGSSIGGNDAPVHIISDRVVLSQGQEAAVFTGKARLWQSGNTVDAPVIELSQKLQVLLAHGKGLCAQCVHSSFVGQPAHAVASTSKTSNLHGSAAGPQQRISAASNGASATAGLLPGMPAVFRVLSDRLLYSDAERKATFTQDVEVATSSYRLLANHAEIFLSPVAVTTKSPVKSRADDRTGEASVQRIVADGNVRLIQPGRLGTGARLVYTAANGRFVLTGSDGRQPKIVDADHGTVSGPKLIFASQQQEIIVGGTITHPTTTLTRVQKK